MKKTYIFAILFLTVLLLSTLFVMTSLSAASGESGCTDVSKATPAVSAGWTRYELENFPVVQNNAETMALVQSNILYSAGKGVGGYTVGVLENFEQIVFAGETAYLKVKVQAQTAGDTQMTLYARKNYEEVSVAVKVNNGSVAKLDFPQFPDTNTSRIGYATMNIHLEKGENTILISTVFQTSLTKRFWLNYDCMDIKDIAAPDTTVPETTAPETNPDDPVALSVNWHLGYVGSSNHTTFKNKINKDGGLYSYTDVITIKKAGTKIYFTDNDTYSNSDVGYASPSAYVISSWKYENDEWVIDLDRANYAGSNASDSVIAKKTSAGMTYTYVTSFDNENIRLGYRSGQSTTFTPAVYPTIYSKYTGEEGTFKPDTLNEWLEQSRKTSYSSCLDQITMSVIGDSYFAGNGLDSKLVWPSLLGLKYKMTFNNYGVNGSTISNYITTNNPMVDRYSAMANNNPDIIIIEGGKNDYNNNVPIGTNNDTVSTTFKGGLKKLIEGIRAKYPDAFIACVTVWNVDQTNSIGKTVRDYGNAMIEICNLYDIPCFNAMDKNLSLVDMTSETFRTQYCMSSSDISHLNADGHKLVMPKFEAFIAEKYTQFKEEPAETTTPDTTTAATTTATTTTATTTTAQTTKAEETPKTSDFINLFLAISFLVSEGTIICIFANRRRYQ